MTAKKPKTKQSNSRGRAPDPPAPPFDDWSDPSQEAEDFFTVLDEIGPGTSHIEIFRMNRDGSRGHVDRVTLQALQEDVYGFLRETYGPGKYLLTFKGQDRRYRGSKVLQVDPKQVGAAPGANPAPGLLG